MDRTVTDRTVEVKGQSVNVVAVSEEALYHSAVVAIDSETFGLVRVHCLGGPNCKHIITFFVGETGHPIEDAFTGAFGDSPPALLMVSFEQASRISPSLQQRKSEPAVEVSKQKRRWEFWRS